MKKVIFLILALQVILAVAKSVEEDSPSKEKIKASTTTAAPPEFASQCFYNFKHERLNKECKAAKPPKCDGAGILVQTTVGEDYEMCCCNV